MACAHTVAIIGGGPAGLAAARALQRDRIAVQVIERSREQAEAGLGITLWPNGTRALDALGVLASVRSRSAAMASIEMRTSGNRLLFAFDLSGGDVLAYPSLTLTRAALTACLQEGLPPVVAGAAVTLCPADGKIAVKLDDGRTISADAVIGADGERSLVRRQLFGPAAGRHAGYLVWRGVAAVQPYPASGISWLGEGAQFGAFPLPEGRTYWFATVATASAPSTAGDERSALGRVFAGWTRGVRDIIAATSSAHLVATHPFAYPGLTDWTAGAVTLIGDAAHPLEPTLGQGACLAFEDAVVLAANVANHSDVGRAFAAYAAERRGRAGALARRAHAFGRAAKWRSRLACSLRDFAIARTPDALHRRQIMTMFGWRPPAPWRGCESRGLLVGAVASSATRRSEDA